MTTIEQYQKFVGQIDTLKQKVNRAEGSLSTQLEKLKDEFKCNNIESAQKLLGKLKNDASKNELDFQTALETFENKWRDTLDD